MGTTARFNFVKRIGGFFSHIDWWLLGCVVPLVGGGLITMNSFVSENYFFEKQLGSVIVALIVFFVLSLIDFRFLRRSTIIVILFSVICSILAALFIFGRTVKGAQSWFDFGFFSFQPSDAAKLMLVFLLAKYFARRHVEIAHLRHIVISGVYTFLLFSLVFLQPDFGSAVIIFLIWFGMVLVAGISWRHLASVFLLGLCAFGALWFFVFQDYQKARVITFISPRADITGSGYNAFQSMIAVGSGQVMGKGVGFGTQSRLKFLPEYQTDFVFSAFAEEWGFTGIIIIFTSYAFLVIRILKIAARGETNFEVFYGLGLAIYFICHFFINVGMNIGLLPITGTPFPFMSYGGTHLLTEFAGLGILMSMRRTGERVHKDDMKKEFLGI